MAKTVSKLFLKEANKNNFKAGKKKISLLKTGNH